MGAAALRWLVEPRGSDPRIGNARWVCGRRGLLQPFWWVAPMTLSLPVVPAVGFCLWSPARQRPVMAAGTWALLAAVVGAQLCASCSDPGIVPRGGRPQSPRDYCSACGLLCPQRTRHCNVLNCCVVGYDHFCPALAACVADRTMRSFMCFLGGCAALGGCSWGFGAQWWLCTCASTAAACGPIPALAALFFCWSIADRAMDEEDESDSECQWEGDPQRGQALRDAPRHKGALGWLRRAVPAWRRALFESPPPSMLPSR
eukprot:TRINITY_DN33010_c0_g1_i2.p2 TRINITY_DN33010_c0_g1~~TRINITY_DN33010_c0_g1_i2.p2  ORF type:complete len:286 (+),score=81.50 TRINITY_DN33010_c0_g1_i2:83-859(+)